MRIESIRIGIAAALLFTATREGWAADHWGSGDFNGDGYEDVVVFRGGAGTLAVGYGHESQASSDPEWRYVPVRRFSFYEEPDTVNIADVDGDGRDDLLIAGRTANRLLVLYGNKSEEVQFSAEDIVFPGGPAGADVADLVAGGRLEVMTPRTAVESPGMVTLQSRSGWGVIDDDPFDRRHRMPIEVHELVIRSVVGPEESALPLLHWFYNSEDGAPTLVRGIPGAGGFSNLTLKRGMRDLDTGFLEGLDTSGHAIVSGRGVETLMVLPSDLTSLGDGVIDSVELGFPVGAVEVAPGPDRDRIWVATEDGSRAFLYTYSATGSLTETDTISPPAGGAFLDLVALEDARLHVSFAGQDGLSADGYGIYADEGNGFELIAEGGLPVFPVSGAATTVVLFSGDPFGAAPVFAIERFSTGDWATGASLSGGQIDFLSETFGGATAGLGTSVMASLEPSPGVPDGAFAMANQFEEDSSLSFPGAPGADGLAAVEVFPGSGTYAQTVAVEFLSGPGVTVHWRAGAGAWSTSPGPVFLYTSATLEYYGTHDSGSVSAIRSASYEVVQPLEADADGDGVPDPVEVLSGTDPFGGSDFDGDGYSDLDELVGGTDPGDPMSVPSDAVPQANEMVASVSIRDPSPLTFLESVSPSVGTSVHFDRLDGAGLAVAPLQPVSDTTARAAFSLDVSVPVAVLATEAELPTSIKSLRGRRMASLVAVPRSGVPVVPVDLGAADPVADWVAGWSAVSVDAEPMEVEVSPETTLAAVVAEGWVARQLVEIGLLDSPEGRPFLVDLPSPEARRRLSEEELNEIEKPRGSGNNLAVHKLAHVVSQIHKIISDDEAYEPLRLTAQSLYDRGSQTSGDLAPQPLRVIRRLLEDEGDLPHPYDEKDLNLPGEALRSLYKELLESLLPKESIVVEGVLSIGGVPAELTVVDLVGGGSHRLVDETGERYWPDLVTPLIDGSETMVVGFPVVPPSGDIPGVLQVAEFTLTDIPVPASGAAVADADGNGLDDVWEGLLLGGIGAGGGFWDDPDGDGFGNGEEYFQQTDPSAAFAFPPGNPAYPDEVVPQMTDGGGLSLIWLGNANAVYDVLVGSGLDGWEVSSVVPVEGPPGVFVWEDEVQDSEGGRRFARVQVRLNGL